MRAQLLREGARLLRVALLFAGFAAPAAQVDAGAPRVLAWEQRQFSAQPMPLRWLDRRLA